MEDRAVVHLRVLTANEKIDRLGLLATVVEGLGHECRRPFGLGARGCGNHCARAPGRGARRPGASSQHALELVSEIVSEAYSPVIAILSAYDASWVTEAARRGVFGYIVNGSPAELQSAIEITLGRFAEVQSLQSAIERRNA